MHPLHVVLFLLFLSCIPPNRFFVKKYCDLIRKLSHKSRVTTDLLQVPSTWTITTKAVKPAACCGQVLPHAPGSETRAGPAPCVLWARPAPCAWLADLQPDPRTATRPGTCNPNRGRVHLGKDHSKGLLQGHRKGLLFVLRTCRSGSA